MKAAQQTRKYSSQRDILILEEIAQLLQGVVTKREIMKAERLSLMIANKARYGASLSVAIADCKEMLALVSTVNLTDDWVTGFTTGEGSFMINYSKSDKRFSGCTFAIALTSSNQQLLWAIKSHLGVGIIRPGREGTDTVQLEVSTLDEIMNVIIPFFDANPILGNKALDYQAFREAAYILYNGQSLTQGGYARLGQLYLSINTSRDYFDPINQVMLVMSPESYPDYKGPKWPKSERPTYNKKESVVKRRDYPVGFTPEVAKLVEEVKLTPQWIAGFTAGEGSFQLSLSKNKGSFYGLKCSTTFQVSQTAHNQHLVWAVWSHLGVGSVTLSKETGMARLQVSGLKDLQNIIIPFFETNLVLGTKALDFRDFREFFVKFVQFDTHVLPEGLLACLKFAQGMNKDRPYYKPEFRVMTVSLEGQLSIKTKRPPRRVKKKLKFILGTAFPLGLH